MEMSFIIVLMKVVDALGVVCVISGFITFSLFVVFLICSLYVAWRNGDIEEYIGNIFIFNKLNSVFNFNKTQKDKDKLEELSSDKVFMFVRKYYSYTIKALIAFIICCSVGAFLPSKAEMITYAVLKSVDMYNKQHETSMLKPENTVGLVDDSLKRLKALINVDSVELDKTVNEALDTVSNVKAQVKKI